MPEAKETIHRVLQRPSGRDRHLSHGRRIPYDKHMSTRELIARELECLPEQNLDKLLSFPRSLKDTNARG